MGKRSLNLNRPVSNHPSNQGLIGWWLALPGQVGGLKYWDISPYRNHAIIAPYAPYSGSFNNYLDGTNTRFGTLQSDGVRGTGYGYCHGADVQVLSSVPPLAQNKPLTISAWIKTTTFTDAQFLTVDDSGGSPTAYNSNGNGYGLRYAKTQNQSNGVAYVNAPCSAPGTWHYLFTQDASNMRMYANGILYDTRSGISSYSNTINRIWFGRNTYQGGSEGVYAGDMVGDVRIRAGATSAAEAAFVYQQRLRGYPDLLAYRSWVSFAKAAAGGATINATAATTVTTTTASTAIVKIAATASTTATTATASIGAVTITSNSTPTTVTTSTSSTGTVKISATASTTVGTSTSSTASTVIGATAATTVTAATSSTGTVTISGTAATTVTTTTTSNGNTTGGTPTINGTAATTVTTSTTSTAAVIVGATAATTVTTNTVSTGVVRISATAATTVNVTTSSTGITGTIPTTDPNVYIFLLGV